MQADSVSVPADSLQIPPKTVVRHLNDRDKIFRKPVERSLFQWYNLLKKSRKNGGSVMDKKDMHSSPSSTEMTVLSKEMFESALHIASVEEAVHTLMNYRKFRTLKDILISFGNGADIRTVLVDGLLLWQPEAVRENVDRKVRNWLNGQTVSIRKQDAFILSRILNLSLEQTNEFLKMASGEGIHWRSPEDIAWCYAIVRDMEPDQILKLLDRVRAMGAVPKATASSSYTQEVHDRLQDVLRQDEDALIAALEAEWDRLGTFHNTAYHLFTQYMDLLKKGYLESDSSYLYSTEDNLLSLSDRNLAKWKKDHAAILESERRDAHKAGKPYQPDQPDYRPTLDHTPGMPELMVPDKNSDQDILEDYLYRKLVPLGNANNQNDPVRQALQRVIRNSWPDTASLSRMRKRQIDIPRKVLILLFLATDGSDSDYEDLEDEDYTPEEAFLDIYTRLNLMLTSCGFLKLDPRSAFDWMILFCISSGDLWESDERLQAMLAEVFPDEN